MSESYGNGAIDRGGIRRRSGKRKAAAWSAGCREGGSRVEIRVGCNGRGVCWIWWWCEAEDGRQGDRDQERGLHDVKLDLLRMETEKREQRSTEGTVVL